MTHAIDAPRTEGRSVLEIDDLSVCFGDAATPLEVVSHVTLRIAAGETLCLVGESGSGKTLTALSVLRLAGDRGATVTGGEVRLAGRNLAALTSSEVSALRGRRVAMVFQEPTTAFDPLFTIGDQIAEVIVRHKHVSRAQAMREAATLLDRVQIPDAAAQLRQYPHQLSGGMRQRAMIAMALSCGPDLLIADEPTTALDVTIQAQILRLLKDLQRETGMSVLLITHDLGIAAQVADRVAVMYAGRLVEQASVEALFERPHHPYTLGLLRSIVPLDSRRASRLPTIGGTSPSAAHLPSGCRFHPRCLQTTAECRLDEPPLLEVAGRQVACWHAGVQIEHGQQARQAQTAWIAIEPVPPATPERRPAVAGTGTPLVETIGLEKHFGLGGNLLHPSRRVFAVDHVSLQIREGETFGLVGESGCGKSTLGRLLLQLERPSAGRILFQGQDLLRGPRRQRQAVRREMQMVFQDPYGSIDPLWSAGEIIGEPLRAHDATTARERRQRVVELMEQVGLDPSWYGRLPHEFSGGQRQRIGIARAIALHPRFIVADEAVSALDVSVQAQVVNLLQDLKERLRLTYLFIGHGLNIVRHLSNQIGVMYLGKLVEIGPVDDVFRRPAHHYTRALVAAIPVPDPRRRQILVPIHGELPSRADPPPGCRFHTRCPAATARCRAEAPDLLEIAPGHRVACHQPA